MDKLTAYRQAAAPLPATQKLWPLYGAGFENLGRNEKPVDAPVPACGPDQLLVRHDACGLCFSDTKVIAQGPNHPRIQRDMKTAPAVLGHELSLTIVGVGERLRGKYRVGERHTIQADITFRGQQMAYGYVLQGGLSQYAAIDERVLANDHGNCLLPANPNRGFAEIALAEPWACVVAAYTLSYRAGLKPGGTWWIVGAGGAKPYTVSAGFDAAAHPARVLLTSVPAGFAAEIRARATALGVEVTDVPDVVHPPVEQVDDIAVLGADPQLIETISPRLAPFGVLAILSDRPMPRKANVDIGRVHYNRWLYVGSAGMDIARAYADTPVRATLKPGGRTWFVGAGGPMGRMHVQRAIQFAGQPGVIVCTDVSDARLAELQDSFADEARTKGIRLVCLNPANAAAFAAGMQPFAEGFDDIVVLAPVPAVIAEAATHLATGGVMNVFAGVARGVMASIDLGDACHKQARIIGHSGSATSDMQLVLAKTDVGELSPNRAVAAVGSIDAAYDGLHAVHETRFPGKVVIYPHIRPFPLTPLADLRTKLPAVYARLRNGCEWTNEAEEEFLRALLP